MFYRKPPSKHKVRAYEKKGKNGKKVLVSGYTAGSSGRRYCKHFWSQGAKDLEDGEGWYQCPGCGTYLHDGKYYTRRQYLRRLKAGKIREYD